MSRRRAFIVVGLAAWVAVFIACKNPKSEEEKKAEVAQQVVAEGWEAALAKTQNQARDKFPDPTIPAGATLEERRLIEAKVAVQRAQWVAVWYGPPKLNTLDLANLHVGDKGRVDAVVRVETVHDVSLVVTAPDGRGGRVRFAVGGVETAGHATGHSVRLSGDYEATTTSDYGGRTLVKIREITEDSKAKWKHQQTLDLLDKAKKEEADAQAAVEKERAPTTAAKEAVTLPAPKKAADAKPAEDPTPKRKAVYVRLVAALDQVEAAAIKKFGRKPKADDLAGFTVPYKVFVERETSRLLGALATELGLARSDLDGIRAEGDDKGWPKK